MGQIVTEHWVEADLRTVFAFFSDPANLPRLMPPSMNVRLEALTRSVSPELENKVVESGMNPAKFAGPGSRIDISFRYFPFLRFRGHWIAEIVEHEPLSHFVDEQLSGPMRRWRHRHSFRTELRKGIAGTVIRDEVEYQLPFGILGLVADKMVFAAMMRRTFRSRQQQLENLLFG